MRRNFFTFIFYPSRFIKVASWRGVTCHWSRWQLVHTQGNGSSRERQTGKRISFCLTNSYKTVQVGWRPCKIEYKQLATLRTMHLYTSALKLSKPVDDWRGFCSSIGVFFPNTFYLEHLIKIQGCCALLFRGERKKASCMRQKNLKYWKRRKDERP